MQPIQLFFALRRGLFAISIFLTLLLFWCMLHQHFYNRSITVVIAVSIIIVLGAPILWLLPSTQRKFLAMFQQN
jgi:cell division protein FtsW (lipid II flippase)